MVEIMQQMPQIEAMCQSLYMTQNGTERKQAEQALVIFSQSPDYIVHCKAILDSSQSPYAQHFASASLLRVITEFSLSTAVKIEMKDYFLTYLDSHVDGIEPFVLVGLVQLVCRLVKICWMEDDVFQKVVGDFGVLLQKGTAGSSRHFLLGLKLLNALVAEFNKPIPGRSLSQHRKLAVHFRDNTLFGVFELALASLRQLENSSSSLDLQQQAMSLALRCLSYDFVGTSLDDSLEDLGTIQVPNSWRRVTEDPRTLELLWGYYSSSTPPLSKESLECLVRLASVRRSLFSSEAERTKFLKHLVTGTLVVLRNQTGLSDHENYHEFCRLLGRLKTNYQLSELVNIEGYQEWIKLVAEFTVRSLKSWQWAKTSIYYLLGLWNRLVTSMPYLKGGESPSLLSTYVPDIIDAYITSRLESVALVLQTGQDEDPLDKEADLHDQMESIPFLCRFQYDQSCPYICNKLDPIMDAYAKWNGQDLQQVEILEGQLTWMVHIVSSIIRGRVNASSTSSAVQETYDGDLSARVFSLLRVMDHGYHQTRYKAKSHQRLDLAILVFFQSFRKVYVGEHVMKSSAEVYARLKEQLNVQDHMTVLNIILNKIALNLKIFGNSDEVIFQTLGIFEELAIGYMSGKLLLKLEAANYILQNHGPDDFAFLNDAAQSRNRTTFYFILAKLLFLDETTAKFKAIISPLQQIFTELANASNGASNAQILRRSFPQQRVIGLFRDLRGIAAAIPGKRQYGNFFDWLYPNNLQTLRCCLDAWKDVPEVANPLLKFVSELAYNKTQRLSFDPSSANGILLFKEISQMIVLYGNHILSASNITDLYSQKYKGIWICFEIIARALGGNYVMYAVFDLYGDPCLKEVLNTILKLALAIPLSDILAYAKLSRAYFNLLDILCLQHIQTLAARDSNTFSFIVSSLDAGLKALECSVSTTCSTAIDNLAGYYFKAINSEDSPSQAAQGIAEHLQKQPELLPGLLNTLFELLLFEDCANQWSLSRPMLTLILVNEQIYPQIQAQIISSQPASRQNTLRACLEKLMDDVQRTLDSKNRDKFTQNLSSVRSELKTKT